FTENAGAVGLFSATTVDPVDAGDLIDTLQLTVDGLADGGDEILVVDGQAIELTHLNSETTAANAYDVDVSVAGSTATVVITKTGGFSPAAAEALVDGLAYNNTSENPQGAARVVTLTSIKDDGGTANGGSDTTAIGIASSVSISAVDDPAAISGDIGYTGNEGDAVAGDMDATDVEGLTDGTYFSVTSPATNGTANIAATTGAWTFTPTDPDWAGSDSFEVTITDDLGGTTTQVVNITLASVNDAPELTAGTVSNLTVNEDSGLTSLGLGGVAYGPGGGADESGQTLSYQVTAIPSPVIGDIFLADGTTQVTAGAYTLAQIQGMQFKPADDATGTTGFQFNVTDSGGTANGGIDSISQFILITVDPLNDAPTVTTTGTQLGYTENDGAVVIDSGLTLADVDSTDLTGATVRIASGFSNSEDVLAFTDQLGITGSYTAATGILTLSGTASVADYQTALRSVTYENTSELPSTTNRVISFQVDDGTAVGSDTRTLTVASINDDPTNNGSLPTDVAVLEGTSSGIDLSAIDFGDLDHNNQLLTVTLTTSTGGNLYASTDIDVIVAGSGTGFMTLTGGIADLNTFFDSATRIQYLHGTANLAGDNVDSIQVQIRDNGNTGSGGGGDITLGTVNIDITNVNDAPAGTNKTVSTAEDIDYVLTTADFGFNDPNDSPSDNLAGVVITTAPSNGTLYVDASGDGIVDGGEALGATDTVAVADILANRLKFKPAPDANGVGYDSFGFQVQDDGGTANGGVDTDPTANTITIDVTNINDAPVFGTVNASPTFTENGGAVGVFSATAVDPVELGDLIDTLQLTVDGLADGSNEILVVDGQAIELTHLNSEATATNAYDVDVSVAGSTATVVITKTGGFSPAAAEALVDGLAYNNTSENPQGAARVITLTSIKDDGGTANGGADTTAIGIASSVSIDTVNDDPTNAGSLPTDLSFLEDTQGKLDLSAIDLSDVDAGSGNLTLTITSANGHLQTLGWPGVTLGGSQSELILTGNLTDLNDFLNDINSIDYEHATPHAAGDNVDLITVQIRDNGNTGSGGGGDITLGTVNIDITDVNDAPAGTNKTVSTAEDTDYVFTTADFGFSDANDSPPDNLAGVVIATAPSNGTLYVDANGDGIVDGGEALGATDTVAVADILANRLKFKPAADAYGVGYDSFDFQVQDDGGTANGGVDTDPTANTITIDVTAAGDPPVIGGT
ncbi:MAG: Ig-like domain-containing protein, partial [Sedimenticolaceae bacterium]